MLTISNAASETIDTMLQIPGVPPEGGLRIQSAPDRRRLSIQLVPGPFAGDLRYDAGDGASLYVAAEIAERVRDRTFDAKRNREGRMQFVLDKAEN